MPKEPVLQVSRDSELKEQALPFRVFIPSGKTNTKRKIGIANGKYNIPHDIDADNEKIAEMFEI